mgnify:CR=1 FL=1
MDRTDTRIHVEHGTYENSVDLVAFMLKLNSRAVGEPPPLRRLERGA